MILMRNVLDEINESIMNVSQSVNESVKSVNDENNDNLDDSLEGEEVGALLYLTLASPASEWY